MNIRLDDRPKRETQSPSWLELPPLSSGDHLTRAEFDRRYRAHPEIGKAELIEGVAYVSSSTPYVRHASPHFNVVGWLGTYESATPGVEGGDNASLRLDLENEPQPDALLRLSPETGGGSIVAEDDYLEGVPELIVEIFGSSASYDLHDKRRAYARNGVPEYLVIQTYEQRVDWFVLREGAYGALEADEKGILRSEVFPGLWLQSAALWSSDLASLFAVLQQGLASPEHATFVERLQARRQE